MANDGKSALPLSVPREVRKTQKKLQKGGVY